MWKHGKNFTNTFKGRHFRVALASLTFCEASCCLVESLIVSFGRLDQPSTREGQWGTARKTYVNMKYGPKYGKGAEVGPTHGGNTHRIQEDLYK